MERVRVGVVEAVIGRGDRVDRAREQRMARRVVDALAVDEAAAAVDERRAVLVPGHHGHRGSPPVAVIHSGWSVQVLPSAPRHALQSGTVAAGVQGASGPREGQSPPEVAVRTV